MRGSTFELLALPCGFLLSGSRIRKPLAGNFANVLLGPADGVASEQGSYCGRRRRLAKSERNLLGAAKGRESAPQPWRRRVQKPHPCESGTRRACLRKAKKGGFGGPNIGASNTTYDRVIKFTISGLFTFIQFSEQTSGIL